MNYIATLLLSVVFLVIIATEMIPLHREIVLIENYFIFLILFTFIVLCWIGILYYTFVRFDNAL